MAPQDDLTAERAAIKLYEKILSYSPDPEALNAGDDKDFEAIRQALKTARQEALREASDLIKLMPMLTAHNVAAVLDRLAREGVR